ncbi:MAG: DNA repair protein RecO [Actinomycetaceae bacterium]|nr:DNA repair protein RecO [Actinomycetaceae bacterium]
MKTYRDEAIVLRTHKLGEADRIVTLLTREGGQIRAVAKGVRKTTSRFGARLEPFSIVDIQLHKGRTLDTITQVETIASHGQYLAGDFEVYTHAHVMVETAERLTADSHDGTHSQYLLLLGGLHALAHRRHAPILVLASYMLRALAIAGWAPAVFDCAVCGQAGPHSAFSIPEGGAVCDLCRPAGASAPADDTMELLGDLLSGNWERAESVPTWAHQEASGLVTSYTQWHLERRLRSLQVLSRSHL